MSYILFIINNLLNIIIKRLYKSITSVCSGCDSIFNMLIMIVYLTFVWWKSILGTPFAEKVEVDLGSQCFVWCSSSMAWAYPFG